MGNGSASDRITDQDVRQIEKQVVEAEAFMAKHSKVKSWEEFSEDDLAELHRLTLQPPDALFNKRIKTHMSELAGLRKRFESVFDWNQSLGGYDE
jgi:TATA-binding protein-associated factor Taf7